MSGELVLVDREALLAELQKVFDTPTAETLLGVLDRVAAQVREAGITREDVRDLKQALVELAEAQRRADERMSSLEAAVERLEAVVERLAEAQQRTEERVDRLEIAVEQFAKEQQETSRSVRELTKAFDRLQKQVGGVSETVGGDIEDIAYIVLYDVLKRELSWDVGVLERQWLVWGGKSEEINVFGQAADPARPGRTIWIVGEAKHNLTLREVDRFARQVQRAREYLVGEIFPVCFCYRARPEVQQRVREAGLRLVFSYGKLV